MNKCAVTPSAGGGYNDEGDEEHGSSTFDIDIIDITIKNVCYDEEMLKRMTEKMYTMYKSTILRHADLVNARTAKLRESTLLQTIHAHNGYKLDLIIMTFLKSDEFYLCVQDIEPFIAPFLKSKLFLYSFLLYFFGTKLSLHLYWKMLLRIMQTNKVALVQFAKDVCYFIGLEFSPDFSVMMNASVVRAIQQVCSDFERCVMHTRALNDVGEVDMQFTVSDVVDPSTAELPVLLNDSETKIYDPPAPTALEENKYLQLRKMTSGPKIKDDNDTDNDNDKNNKTDDDDDDEMSEMGYTDTRSEISDVSTAWSISSMNGPIPKRKVVDTKLKILQSISKLDTDADLTAYVDELYADTPDGVCKLLPLNYFTKVRMELMPYIQPLCPLHLAHGKGGQLKKLRVIVLLLPYIFEHGLARHVYDNLRHYKRVTEEYTSVDLTTIAGICIYLQFCTEVHLLMIITEINQARIERWEIKKKI